MGRLKNICSQKHISNLFSKAGIRENTSSSNQGIIIYFNFFLFIFESFQLIIELAYSHQGVIPCGIYEEHRLTVEYLQLYFLNKHL